MRSQAVLAQQFQPVVNDVVLGIRQQGRFWEGIRAAELRDDVVRVLLRTEALAFEHVHNRGNLLHVGDGRLFDGQGARLGRSSLIGNLQALGPSPSHNAGDEPAYVVQWQASPLQILALSTTGQWPLE
jgi:hypothetical protein